MKLEHSTDVLIIGSGVAALSTALVVCERGLKPLVVESTAMLGGNSAVSAGALWIPNNHVMKRAGQTDSYEEARAYLDACVGDVGPASSPARRAAYLTRGPEMAQWLESLGFRWVFAKGYSDYYPERSGGKPMGRAIEGRKYDIKRLGSWADKLRFTLRTMPVYSTESHPRVKPNPNLGAVERPPFYAVKVFAGDLGTKGGILTDEHARALREDGSVIDRLYAVGNCSASVMGRTYPGPGATLGPAAIFGFIGGNHMADVAMRA